MEWTPMRDGDPELPGKYWITVAGYSKVLKCMSEPVYQTRVGTAFWFEGRWVDLSCSIDWGERIVAYQPYVSPEPFKDNSRCSCRLCDGSGDIGEKTCWRCGGRGDEAVDGSDVVHKMTPEMREEYGLK